MLFERSGFNKGVIFESRLLVLKKISEALLDSAASSRRSIAGNENKKGARFPLSQDSESPILIRDMAFSIFPALSSLLGAHTGERMRGLSSPALDQKAPRPSEEAEIERRYHSDVVDILTLLLRRMLRHGNPREIFTLTMEQISSAQAHLVSGGEIDRAAVEFISFFIGFLPDLITRLREKTRWSFMQSCFGAISSVSNLEVATRSHCDRGSAAYYYLNPNPLPIIT